ncbi:unnamed protein product [Boreogadus saida]
MEVRTKGERGRVGKRGGWDGGEEKEEEDRVEKRGEVRYSGKEWVEEREEEQGGVLVDEEGGGKERVEGKGGKVGGELTTSPPHQLTTSFHPFTSPERYEQPVEENTRGKRMNSE